MKIKWYRLCCLTVLCLLLWGCGTKREEETTYQKEYETYEVDSQLRYKAENQEYQYRLRLTDRSNNAVSDSYYVVLSNDETLSFEEVDNRFWSSTYTGNDKFCIVEYGIIESD